MNAVQNLCSLIIYLFQGRSGKSWLIIYVIVWISHFMNKSYASQCQKESSRCFLLEILRLVGGNLFKESLMNPHKFTIPLTGNESELAEDSWNVFHHLHLLMQLANLIWSAREVNLNFAPRQVMSLRHYAECINQFASGWILLGTFFH